METEYHEGDAVSDAHILHGLGVEYRYISGGEVSDAASRERDFKDRVAELEADNQTFIDNAVFWRKRAHGAEAELAALKARRCDGCGEWHNYAAYPGLGRCRQIEHDVDDDFACNCWAERV